MFQHVSTYLKRNSCDNLFKVWVHHGSSMTIESSHMELEYAPQTPPGHPIPAVAGDFLSISGWVFTIAWCYLLSLICFDIPSVADMSPHSCRFKKLFSVASQLPPMSQTVKRRFLYSTVSTLKPGRRERLKCSTKVSGGLKRLWIHGKRQQ